MIPVDDEVNYDDHERRRGNRGKSPEALGGGEGFTSHNLRSVSVDLDAVMTKSVAHKAAVRREGLFVGISAEGV